MEVPSKFALSQDKRDPNPKNHYEIWDRNPKSYGDFWDYASFFVLIVCRECIERICQKDPCRVFFTILVEQRNMFQGFTSCIFIRFFLHNYAKLRKSEKSMKKAICEQSDAFSMLLLYSFVNKS